MRFGVVAGTCAALLLALSSQAAAYCVFRLPSSGNPNHGWDTLPINYRVSDNMTDPDILAAIDAAFQTWQEVECSQLTFAKGPQFSLGEVEFEHQQEYLYIFWHTEAWEGFANSADPNMPFATNRFTLWNMQDGISGGSIAVNGADYKWDAAGGASDTFDVKNEMIYLIGAAVGLAPTPEAGHAMSKGIKFGDTSRYTLSQDDIDGLLYLYLESGCTEPPPPDDPNTCAQQSVPAGDGGTQPTGDGGVTPSGDGSAPSGDNGVPPSGDGAAIGDGGVTRCTSSAQCAEGEVCTAEGVCQKVGGEEDDGCCRVSHARHVPLSSAFLALLGLLLVLGQRYRRR